MAGAENQSVIEAFLENWIDYVYFGADWWNRLPGIRNNYREPVQTVAAGRCEGNVSGAW
jgi:hypothetical protein